MTRRYQSFTVDIPGLPEAQGSAKAFVVAGKARITSTNTKLTAWRRDAIMAVRAVLRDREPLASWVEVRAECRFPRPAAHFGTGRNASTLKPSAPYFKTSKPDSDKLARAILDALTGAGVYRDDSQVVRLSLEKRYVGPGEFPGTSLRIAWADELADGKEEAA